MNPTRPRHQTPLTHKTSPTCALLAALVLTAGAAHAQNALGDGRGLERDLRVGGTGNAPRANFMNEVRARNALVTGNAPGGKSLRINPGYTAPDDFRGTLASDDLFSFRRDSQPAVPGYGPAYRGTQGLQFQSAYTTGNTAPNAGQVTRLDSFGSGTELPRSGFRPRSSGLPEPRSTRSVNPLSPARADGTADPIPGDEPAGGGGFSPVATLRSTGAFVSTYGLTPSVVGVETSERGQRPITASSLLGVRAFGDDVPDARLTARELADKPAAQRPNSAAGPDMSTKAPSTSAAEPAFRTSYDDLRMRLGTNATAPDAVKAGDKSSEQPGDKASEKAGAKPGDKTKSVDIPEWEQHLRDLREELSGRRKPDLAKTAAADKADPAKGTDAKNSDSRNADGKDAKEGSEKKLLPGELDEETARIISRAGGDVGAYSTGAPGSLFDVHVRSGEEALAKGQYFDAEERFARALAMRPGDVSVMAARLNSQLGAGLNLSAAVNLRQLLEQHPEVIGVRYTGKAMPPATRTATLASEMREKITKAKAQGRPAPEEAALLLAYVGFQTKDAEATREGLEAMASTPAGAKDALLPLLRRVWRVAPAPAPAENPAAAPFTPTITK